MISGRYNQAFQSRHKDKCLNVLIESFLIYRCVILNKQNVLFNCIFIKGIDRRAGSRRLALSLIGLPLGEATNGFQLPMQRPPGRSCSGHLQPSSCVQSTRSDHISATNWIQKLSRRQQSTL